MSAVIKKIPGSANDVRVAKVNNRAIAIIRRNGKGYAVDELYGLREKHYDTYTEAREQALKAPQTG